MTRRGKAPVKQLARHPHIEVTGYVPDIRPYIAQARIAVCPLPYAVGVQFKALEAMASGTPVIVSSHVAAGLQAIDQQDLLVADQPAAFAAAVLRLLDDQHLWDMLSTNGLSYIATHHAWEHIMRQLTAVYRCATTLNEKP